LFATAAALARYGAFGAPTHGDQMSVQWQPPPLLKAVVGKVHRPVRESAKSDRPSSELSGSLPVSYVPGETM
jgi:hypothetical protein